MSITWSIRVLKDEFQKEARIEETGTGGGAIVVIWVRNDGGMHLRSVNGKEVAINFQYPSVK